LTVVVVALGVCAVTPVYAETSPETSKIRAIDRMMIELAADSLRDAAEIRRVYQEYLNLLVLDDYTALEGSLLTGGLVPLPERPILFNLAPRLDGLHPIGEKDLSNQASYASARPAAIGALLEIASRVTSSPLEITSLVRHGGYQDALRITNANATTSVPTHTMGLAIDIALVHTPLATAYQVRDVLLRMRAAGDLLFIGERQQLVFHVVPHPSRLGYFNDVYAAALGSPGSSRAIEVLAPAPPRLLDVHELQPQVSTEVVSILPVEEQHWAHWFDAPAEPATRVVTGPRPAPRRIGLQVCALGLLPLSAGLAMAVALNRGRARRPAPDLGT
jgi:hypothetical protein